MLLANYHGALTGSGDGRQAMISRMWRDAQREARGQAALGPPDEWELMTRRGQMRAGMN